MNDWYLVGQLKKFRSGMRGTHPEDMFGQQMIPFATALLDEQAVSDVDSIMRFTCCDQAVHAATCHEQDTIEVAGALQTDAD